MPAARVLDPLLVAEDAEAFVAPWSTQVIADLGDCIARHGPDTDPMDGGVFRVRFETPTVDDRVDAVRAWMAAQGRDAFCWWVGASATPSDLADRLLARGAVPSAAEPVLTPMAIDHEPPAGPAGIHVRPVANIEEYRAAREITGESFGVSETDREAARARLADEWAEAERDGRIRLMAWIDGQPAAYAILVRLSVGAFYLAGGATSPAFRGRGAYRALVHARWAAAVALGSPMLVIQAGQHSRPILERLGFRSGPPIRILVDRSIERAAEKSETR